MGKNHLNIAVTGAGRLGRDLAEQARNYGAKIVAVHDAIHPAAQKMAADHPGTTAVENLTELFEGDLDGLIVTTPPPVRLEPVKLATERGVHLFIEKPPAMTMEEGCQCLELIEGSGVMTALGFNLRYEGMYEQLRELLQGEEIHLVRTVCTIDYYLNFHMSPWFLQKAISGGPIAEQAIHPLDCVRYVLGGRQARRALLAGEKNMAMERTEFDAENALQLIYELEGGIYGTHMNHCGHERFCFDLEFVGPHLRLTAHAMDSHIKGFMRGKEVMIARRPLSTGLGKVQSWLEAIKTGNRDLIRSDYRDALKTLALVEAALKSHQTRSFEKVEAL